MAAVLEQNGVVSVIRDYPASGGSWDTFTKDIIDLRPDMLIISATTPTLKDDLQAARIAKEHNPDIRTIAKGAHLFSFARQILTEHPFLDIAIRSECEFAVQDIIRNTGMRNIPGITWRDGGVIVENNMPVSFGDLNTLPFPARHLLDNNRYLSPDNNRQITLILTNRGCPNECIYCLSHVISGKTIRQRTPQNIVAEIEECLTRHNIHDFFFRADTFTWDKQWLMELCRLIIDKKLNIRWGTNSRVNTIDEDRLRIMKQAGCDIIGFGIESGNQEILKLIKKNITLQQSIKAVRLCKEYRIKTYLFFILGFPWDTKETIEETIDFAAALDADFYNFFIAYPFPGTELYALCEQHNLFEPGSLYDHDFFRPVIRTFTLSNKELSDLEKRAQRRLFFRPRMWLRMLADNPSPRAWFNFLKAGAAMIGNIYLSGSTGKK